MIKIKIYRKSMYIVGKLNKYKNTFESKKFIDWLIENKDVAGKKEAIELCTTLHKFGLLHHGN